MTANTPFKILFANLSATEKEPERMVMSYATRNSAIHITAAGTGDMFAGIYERLDIMADQSTAATIRLPQTEVTDLSFAASDKKNNSSTSTNNEPLISRPIKTKRNTVLRQQDPQVGNLETKLASPQNWQSMVYLFVADDQA